MCTYCTLSNDDNDPAWSADIPRKSVHLQQESKLKKNVKIEKQTGWYSPRLCITGSYVQ